MPKILTIILFICSCLNVNAQRIELGLTGGCMNYVGDLAPNMVMSETHIAYGVFGRYNISSSFALTISRNKGSVSGSDQNVKENQFRNLSFKTSIDEYMGVIEFNYLKYALGILDKKYTSYVFLGAGLLRYNPQTYFEGSWVDLRPIQTENVAYNDFTMIVPFGIGFKWRFAQSYALEANIGFRKVFTDYIDDVSSVYPDPASTAQKKGAKGAMITDRTAELNGNVPQYKVGDKRGNADFNDWYVSAGISFSYRIFAKQKCPRFF